VGESLHLHRTLTSATQSVARSNLSTKNDDFLTSRGEGDFKKLQA
jgi:hypothetical protein